MGRSKHCTFEERNHIKRLIASGKHIVKYRNCSAKKVYNALHWKGKGETRGRKRATASRTDRKMIRLVKMQPHITSRALKEELDLPISTSTVRKRLIEAELQARSPRKVPLLTSRHIHNRLNFANSHVNWPIQKWRNILWTDESKVELFGSSGRRMFVRRPPGAEFQPQYTVKTVKHGGAKIMVWGCFSYHGVGPIHRIEGLMDAVGYVEILQNIMLPYAEEEMPLKWIFQQDNDPKHTSRRAKAWFRDNNVDVMDWPAQSPDLNPIENLWGDIKKAVFEAKPTNAEQQWAVVRRAWSEIPVIRCQKLVDSMSRRCAAVIRNNGYTTKY
jgi:hypothetical protein